MRQEPNYLFRQRGFNDFKRERQSELKEDIAKLGSSELENSTDSLALIFASKFSPSPIQLHEPVHEDVGQVEKTVERFSRGLRRDTGKVIRKVQRLKVKVPYSGERKLLHIRPTSRTSSFPTYDELTDSEIVHYVDYQVEGKDSEEIKATIQNDVSSWKDELEDYVDRLNSNFRKMRSRFEDKARSRIEDHRENMEAKKEALADLGISTGTTERGFVAPEKKQDLELPDLKGASEERNRLRDQTFIEVLDVIDSMKVSVERAHKQVRNLDEEPLREIFLGAIDSHYGTATGESFNRGGKTDILLKHQGENLFVAECKFWRGESMFHDAIDQLLANLTRDDGHAALLVFSDREQFSQVCETVEETIPEHESFESTMTRFRNHNVYRFSRSSDSEVKIAVKLVDLAS